MINRLASAALIAFHVTTSSSQVSSRETETFVAWGYTFDVPAFRATTAREAAHFGDVALTTGSIPTGRPHVSIKAGAASENASAANARASRTLSVWGARLDAPAY